METQEKLQVETTKEITGRKKITNTGMMRSKPEFTPKCQASVTQT